MDFFAKLSGKRDDPVPPPLFSKMEDLLFAVEGERKKLERALSSINGDDAEAVPRVIERLEERAFALTGQLETMSSRVDELGHSTGEIAALQARIASLEEALQRAEARADQTVNTVQEAVEQRTALQELVSLAQSTMARLETVMADTQVAQMTEQLPIVRRDCDRVVEQQQIVEAQLSELQATTVALVQHASSAAEASKRAEEQAAEASDRLTALHRKLDEVIQFEASASDTTAQIQTLNALAEHVTMKVKALESQQQTIDRALVDSRRVNEMVWEMNVQIDRLREGSTLAASVEETLVRLERHHQEIAARLESASRERTQFIDTVEQQRQKSVQLLRVLQTQLDQLALQKTEMDTINERLTAAHSGLADTERRLAALSSTEKTLSDFADKLNAFAAQTESLATQMASIEQKQPFLDTLEARLTELDGETRRAGVQVESLTRRRQELVSLKSEFDGCEATYANVRKLADDLSDQQRQFALFAEQVREFMLGAPALDGAIGSLKTRVADTEARAERVISMRPQLADIAGRLDLLTPRFQVVDDLQERLNRLHGLSREIDERLAAQLGRHTELEQARVACDGLATQIFDAHQKLGLLQAAQSELASVPGQIAQVGADLISARQTLAAIRLDGESIAGQERRLTEARESADVLFTEIGARLETLRTVQSDLNRTNSLKQDLYQKVAEILAIEKETFERHREAQLLLEQFSARWKQVDQRRAELGVVEQSMRALEERIGLLDRLAGDVDVKIASLAERDRIVDAVKQEIDVIHEVARQCQDNLAAIADQRIAISEGRADIDQLAKALSVADEKLAEVERRTAAVDDVRRKADAVACLLDDVRVTLDTVSEQKATIDHVNEMLARVDDVIVEARGTTKALQAERKLAQRIVESVRAIHARAGAEIRQGA